VISPDMMSVATTAAQAFARVFSPVRLLSFSAATAQAVACFGSSPVFPLAERFDHSVFLRLCHFCVHFLLLSTQSTFYASTRVLLCWSLFSAL
jgi:hypothetical protein